MGYIHSSPVGNNNRNESNNYITSKRFYHTMRAFEKEQCKNRTNGLLFYNFCSLNDFVQHIKSLAPSVYVRNAVMLIGDETLLKLDHANPRGFVLCRLSDTISSREVAAQLSTKRTIVGKGICRECLIHGDIVVLSFCETDFYTEWSRVCTNLRTIFTYYTSVARVIYVLFPSYSIRARETFISTVCRVCRAHGVYELHLKEGEHLKTVLFGKEKEVHRNYF